MNIIQRFSDIMRSNINALLDKAEDPAKLVDQYLLDARKNLADVKFETASVMANEKAARRAVDECRESIKTYEDSARKALASGNEGDARKLLEGKQKYEAQLTGLEKSLEAAQAQSNKMRQMYDKLTDDIRELEARKETVKAKNATAKAQEAVNRAGTMGKRGQDANDAFARMERKADERLDKALATAELDEGIAEDENLVKKYCSGSSSSVDDELSRMKAEMGIQ